MSSLLREAFQNSTLHAPPLTHLQQRLRLITDSRYTYAILLLLGVIRVIVFTIAYPPAHGADSADYFLYAAQFDGLDAPIVFELIYPLYPLFIYLTHYVLGSIYILIGLQFVLSAVQGAIIYAGLRPYSPTLAFITALMVLGDAQTGILYNFISTEPLYMFLLSVAFSLYLIQLKGPSDRRWQARDMLLGVVLALVLLMRPVGRYLIVPFGVLFLLGTRSLWRTAAVAASYAVMLALSVLFNQIVFDQFELNGGGSFMLSRPLIISGLLEADDGPASARVVELLTICPFGKDRSRCLLEHTDGSWAAVGRLHTEAYQEMLEAHPREYAELVIDEFTDFLQLSGVQYRGEVKPSDAQCADLDAKTERDTLQYVEKDWLLYGASDATYDKLRPIIYDISAAMCPSWPDNDTVSRAVDRLALRYKSLSRPRPYLWYLALGAAVLVIPWARHRLLFPVLLSGAILANHAAISAVVLNVQPRYISVMNPYKGFLLLALIYIAAVLALRLFDAWLARRARTAVQPPASGQP